MKPSAVLAAVFFVLFWASWNRANADWPGFRGPNHSGASKEKNLPTEWGEKKNVAWKAPLPGPGASSPVVWGDRVFVTCWSGYADRMNKPGDINKLQRHLVCLDRKTGKILWKRDVPARKGEAEWSRSIGQHGYATHTPATDGKYVYVFFGMSGVRAFDLDGKEIWHADVGKYTNVFGTGASPTLWKDFVIVNAAVEGGGLIALDKKSGKRVWRVKLYDDSWSTPVVVDRPGKKQELVLLVPAFLYGFDPATGKKLWQCDCDEPGYVSATPVNRNGIVYVMGSGRLGKVCMAVKTGGKGDVTKTHIVWKQKVGASFTSPVLAGDYLYFFSSLAYCLNLKTGKIVFEERLNNLGREYASPVTADGKIYLFTRSGAGHVLATGGKFQQIAQNYLGEFDSFVASPALNRGQILVRTNGHVYCLGK